MTSWELVVTAEAEVIKAEQEDEDGDRTSSDDTGEQVA